MKAVVLAAGYGSRIGKAPKPLLKVGGIEIILRTMKLLSDYVDEFIVVAGVFYDEIENFLKKLNFKYKMIKNKFPERGNGYSLYLAKDHVDDRFVLVMGDHVYSREFVEKAIKGYGLIVDANPKYVDIDEATKVKVKNNRVEDIGKDLKEFDCLDTGFFILDKSIFKVAEGLLSKDEISVSEIVRKAKIPVSFVNGEFWMDIDTKDDLKRANYLIVRSSVKSVGDGFVSRFINRKISTRISAILVNRVTPNQMTVLSFLVGLISALLVFVNTEVAGLLYQISSILDGCDGEIARASLRESKFGGYIDSILDRFVDFIFLCFLATLIPMNTETLVLVLFAVFGSFMVSYSTEKYKADFGKNIYAEIRVMRYLIGKRDERIFLIMIFCLLGLIYPLFWIIALITNLRVLATMIIVAKYRK